MAFNSVAGEKNHLLNVQSIAVENPALEQIGMADTTHKTDARGSPSRSRGDTSTEEATVEAGSDTLRTISGIIYSGSYALAYGVVYAAVFVAQSLPQENPVMSGFQDGGRAAIDELGAS